MVQGRTWWPPAGLLATAGPSRAVWTAGARRGEGGRRHISSGGLTVPGAEVEPLRVGGVGTPGCLPEGAASAARAGVLQLGPPRASHQRPLPPPSLSGAVSSFPHGAASAGPGSRSSRRDHPPPRGPAARPDRPHRPPGRRLSRPAAHSPAPPPSQLQQLARGAVLQVNVPQKNDFIIILGSLALGEGCVRPRGGRWCGRHLGHLSGSWAPRAGRPGAQAHAGGPDGDGSAGPGAGGEYYIMKTNHSTDWNLITSLLSW